MTGGLKQMLHLAPDGTQNASTLDFSAIDGLFRFITASGNPDTKTFTASVYLKAGTATSARIRILGSSGGLGIVSEDVTLTNDWQRFSVTSTFSGTGDNVRIRVQSFIRYIIHTHSRNNYHKSC
jgi:hypothetical protein